MKKFLVKSLLIVGAVLPAASFAEGEGGANAIDTTSATTAVTSWVDACKTALEGYVSTLGPLFGVGITLILLVIGWRLFRRTTKQAS